MTRSDHGKKTPRDLNASSSSTTLNYTSSSHPLDDIVDVNDEELFCSNSSSLSQNVSFSFNVVSRVIQNPPHESQHLNTYLSETIDFQAQQRDDHLKGLSKDEAIDKFVIYKTKVENQIGRKIKVVRSDRGGEYVSPFGDLYERQDQLEEEEVEPRRSKKARTEKSFGPDFVSFMVENEPASYREAVTSSEGHQWKKAIKSEIYSILQNHTWVTMDLPHGCKPLGYKWIFMKKMKADGTINKYKARLVIKGFRQREGLDYFDTYLPVMKRTSIRMVLVISALIIWMFTKWM
nr:retrotransposon protein, putative, Ty1-copia subclass [Tanacetum cinerariifolium]